MFRFDLDTAILAALHVGDAHGYLVMSRIAERTDGEVRVSVGQLYPALHRLELEELVESVWEPQEGKPDRRTYRLTESGSKRLASRASDWRRFSESVSRLMEGGNAA
jgi:DNA-binding PadR family transcriptional regulator